MGVYPSCFILIYLDLTFLFADNQTIKQPSYFLQHYLNSFDKSLAEKLSFIEQLDKKDKVAFHAVLDAFIGKKKLKDALSNVLHDVK